MIDPNTGRILLMLLLGGILYDVLVNFIQDQLPNRHGVTSWLVVGGVLGTLIGYMLLDGVQAFLTVLLCFVASGTPMVMGSMLRYWRGGWR